MFVNVRVTCCKHNFFCVMPKIFFFYNNNKMTKITKVTPGTALIGLNVPTYHRNQSDTEPLNCLVNVFFAALSNLSKHWIQNPNPICKDCIQALYVRVYVKRCIIYVCQTSDLEHADHSDNSCYVNRAFVATLTCLFVQPNSGYAAIAACECPGISISGITVICLSEAYFTISFISSCV